jgi:antitoxin VapB
MNLNIKSAEAHRMAVQLAKQTGDSITGAVTKAIQSELRRTRDNTARIARIEAITLEMSEALKGVDLRAEIDDLYDEMGLPK